MKESAMVQATQLTVNPAEEMIRVGPLGIRFLVTGENPNGSVAVFELRVPAGEAIPAPAHSHDAYEETVYGLTGVLNWTVDGQRIEVGPGQALSIPRGVVHRFDNPGQTDATMLSVVSTAGVGPAYFREVGAVLAAGAGQPPDMARMIEIMRRHGLSPAAPGA
jgi:quercetin dioxygenase-like cupin family protein